jgi:hypothetical protein
MKFMIIEEVAKAIGRSDKTRYRIAVDCGIDHAVIHRIVHGGSCSVETLDKLCEYLGLELRPVKKRAKSRRKDR